MFFCWLNMYGSCDWDQVTQGLVKLGFKLIDSFGPKPVFGVLPDNDLKQDSLSPSQQACQLGQRLLLKTFKVHHVFRDDILNTLFGELMKPTSPVTQYLESDIVTSSPQLLLESTNKVCILFEKLDKMNPKSAERLLSALQPLLKLSPFLKDTLILNLRKAMFSRPLDSRKIGALGFLMILKHFRVVGALPSSQISQPISLSQIQADVHSSYSPASNEALCLEIIGNLSRCLTQHVDVRLNIYQGLCEVLLRNSELMNPVLDLLFFQLKKYYEFNEDVKPPLRLEPCIITHGDKVYLAEPLAHLVGCAQQCLRKSQDIQSQKKSTETEDDDQDGCEETFQKLQNLLVTLTKRVIEAEMEDFELDKSADFSLATGVGVKNNINAILLLGLYEVLMEFTFEMGKYSIESCKEVLQLFTKHAQLSTVVKEKSAASSGKKNKTSTTKTPNSLIALKAVEKFLTVIICDERPELEENGIDQLIQNKGFLTYILSIAVQKLGQVASKGTCEGETQSKEKLLKVCFNIGRLLYISYIDNQQKGDSTDQKDRKLNSQILEGLNLVIEMACKNGQNAVLQCLSSLEKETEMKERLRTSQKNEKIHNHIKKFQRLVVTILNENKDSQNLKEVFTLFSIIAHLVHHLPSHGEEYQQTFNWLQKVAIEHPIDDAATCRHLISLMLQLSKQTKSLPQILLSLCQDIHSQLGDIDQDCEVEQNTHFAVTKANICPISGILTLTLTYLEADLDDIDSVIKCHKANMLAANTCVEEETATQVETLDRSICIRLGLLINSFIELTHSAVTTSPCIHAMLKTVTKLFNVLTSLTKHYISLYTNKAGHLGSRFEKLVRLVSQQLTPQTYNMIIYVQLLESDVSEESEKKGKKKNTTHQKGIIKAMKQGKMVPSLICTIELLEKFLIQLSKKSKVNLAENFKRSTSRDFRINTETVHTAVEQGISDDSETEENNSKEPEENEVQESNEDDDDDEENKRPVEEEKSEHQPPQKKKKTTRNI
ncbi:Fanconi anemia group I protein-like isoform X3 [Biomphalaria glabrata]|uniref:Fanconi anemia group I protein-like isoform X3 n=1 Tax=Biomphalaria glabrata TaxID=6526 RepID=A0A9W3AYV7_BIOGL|nr:Fanconi anemia group I protein-like isoform X3 [Biomphalaria glabrata]